MEKGGVGRPERQASRDVVSRAGREDRNEAGHGDRDEGTPGRQV
jgi:hypothetical protein